MSVNLTDAVAVDTSALIAFTDNTPFPQEALLAFAFREGKAYLPPLTLFETLSGPKAGKYEALFLTLPMLELMPHYWQRAAAMRRELIRQGFKASAGDVLIAQSCIDNEVPLITLDKDFRHFVRYGLILAAAPPH